MQHTSDTRHTPGTVIVPASSLARYSEFWLAVEQLVVPYGTRLVCMRGADIPYQFNEGIRHSTGDWCWFLGDDHTFEPDLLLKLLDHDKDVIMPVVPRRDPPFVPVLMHGPLGLHMARYNWSELPLTGLFQLPVGDSAGQAGVLVKKTVLDQLGDPWFEGGKLTPGRLMEDMYFIKRLHDLNVPIYVDCDQTMGHIANIAVIPMKHEGRWYAGYKGPAGPVLWDEPDWNYLPAGTKIV